MTRQMPAWLAFTLLLGSAAFGDQLFPVMEAEVGSSGSVVSLPVPTGTFGGYVMEVDWSTDATAAYPRQAFSSKARWSLEIDGCEILLAAPRGAASASDTVDSITLIWAGPFPYDIELPGPGAIELNLRMWQTEENTTATWSNIRLTLTSEVAAAAVPPAATDMGMLWSGTYTATGSLYPADVNWYKFRLYQSVSGSVGEYLTAHTLFSSLSDAGTLSGTDTELGIYNWAGYLVATSDDISLLDGQLSGALEFGMGQSELIMDVGDLGWDACDGYRYVAPNDYYYIAVGGYDTVFGPSDFDVMSTSDASGEVTLSLTTYMPTYDCNGNTVEDALDILDGYSSDCNTNGIPDECDVAGLTSNDCQPDGVPDECELDVDCNGNMVPDSCDIASGELVDCDGNGVADLCDLPQIEIVFEEDFPTYNLDSEKWPDVYEELLAFTAPHQSAPRSLRLAPSVRAYQAPIDLSGVSWATLRFSWRCPFGDVLKVTFWNGATWVEHEAITSAGDSAEWHQYVTDIPSWAIGESTRFGLLSTRDFYSSIVYWDIDDIVVGIEPADCDSNGVPDSCEIAQFGAADCNGNQILDVCEIAAGAVVDFDGDGLIAECDPDIDGDGVANEDDLCAESPLSVPVNPNGGPMGDFDDSCALELDDYYFMEICLYLSGPEGDPGFADCQSFFDFNSDSDVDLQDFAAFQAGFGG